MVIWEGTPSAADQHGLTRMRRENMSDGISALELSCHIVINRYSLKNPRSSA
jgi:hypothetical protein